MVRLDDASRPHPPLCRAEAERLVEQLRNAWKARLPVDAKLRRLSWREPPRTLSCAPGLATERDGGECHRRVNPESTGWGTLPVSRPLRATTGCNRVQARPRFGTRKSQVQILSPRPNSFSPNKINHIQSREQSFCEVGCEVGLELRDVGLLVFHQAGISARTIVLCELGLRQLSRLEGLPFCCQSQTTAKNPGSPLSLGSGQYSEKADTSVALTRRSIGSACASGTAGSVHSPECATGTHM